MPTFMCTAGCSKPPRITYNGACPYLIELSPHASVGSGPSGGGATFTGSDGNVDGVGGLIGGCIGAC